MSRKVYLADKTIKKYTEVISVKVRRLLEEGWAELDEEHGSTSGVA